MTKITTNQPPSFNSSNPGNPNTDPNNGAFNAGVNKLIADGYKSLLFGGLGNLPGLSGKGSSDPTLEKEIEAIDELLELFKYASDNYSGDYTSFAQAVLNSIKGIKDALKGTSLGDALDKLTPFLQDLADGKITGNIASQVLAAFNDSKTGLFSALNDWFSDNGDKIIAFLRSSGNSIEDKEQFLYYFMQIMTCLMDSKIFNEGKGLDKLFFAGSMLGYAFPELLFDYYLRLNNGNVEAAKKGYLATIASYESKVPSGIPDANYQEFLSNLKNYDFHVPSKADVQEDIEDLIGVLANFLT